nr:uncharacterized protein LOC104108685 isoform X2 [Nicotiana tomentosiformis]
MLLSVHYSKICFVPKFLELPLRIIGVYHQERGGIGYLRFPAFTGLLAPWEVRGVMYYCSFQVSSISWHYYRRSCQLAGRPHVISFSSNTEMQAAEGKLCRRKSKTFSGYCFISEHCDEECKEKEGAKRGMCIKKSIFRRYCYCYHTCK